MRKRFLSLSLSILLISMFAVLSACATENEFGIREKENKNMVKLDEWGDTGRFSTSYLNKITLTGEEGSEFVCSTSSNNPIDEGKFLSHTQTSDTLITVSSGTTISWYYRHYDETGMHIAENETIWLEFINRKDSQIIGYAVVRVDKIADYYYDAEVVKAVTFPKVGGNYQTVTEEQVNQLIKNAENL